METRQRLGRRALTGTSRDRRSEGDAMRKYLLNWGVVSTALGVVSVIQTTRNGPRDWRLLLAWASWMLSLAVVITTVHDHSKQVESKH